MVTTLRAALSVLLLVGFYAVAGGIVVAVAAWALWERQTGSGANATKLGFVALVLAVAIVTALVKVARARPAPEPGVVVPERDAPELWATVRELADAAGTRAPDEIRLVPVVNAAVAEDARLLGLVAGTRRLYLGVPLVAGLDVARLRSVLAHELGHYSHSHTRLAPIAYRGRAVMRATLEEIGGGPVGWVLLMYARLYGLVSASVSRRQELEADALSVRVAGRATAQAALRELPVVDAAWDFYLQRYVDPGWQEGLAPTAPGFFEGFVQLLAARGDELAAVRAEAPPREQTAWDSHPSLGARVDAMQAMPSGDVPVDTRPATALLPTFTAAAAAVAEGAVEFEDRERLDWDALTARALATGQQRVADSVYRTAARAAGVPRGTLGTVLDLVAAGRGRALTDEVRVEPTGAYRNHRDAPLRDLLHVVVRAAAVQASAARWQHSWDGPARLVGPDGPPPDVVALVDAAVAGDAAAARARLAGCGIDADAVGQVAERGTAHGGRVLGGIGPVDVDGAPHDVVHLDNGLLLLPCDPRKGVGRERMATALASAPVVALARRHRFVAFEDVAHAEVHKRTPLTVTFTLHDGSQVALRVRWSSDQLAKGSDDRLHDAALRLAPTAAPVG
ncbi:M48 family metalloprotease [Cellulomonas sp. JZ18]|uniref:M48 family metallopeptidase n=1 Tax=Cellulomonas sp. JZ18 TaxID=2654191 RepID=UPI0012D3F2F5|nr:M48 family metallopeptidase [Cellulomonas sp. JZ18]QGQ18226.1 M48 family metalloprotease [Cellulomonas sp. JZ18]